MTELQRKYEKQIAALSAASIRCSELGFVASQGGNLSARVADDVVLITPTKLAKRRVLFDDVCIIRMNGEVLYAAEGRRPTGEVPMHTHIYEKRPDIRALVHAHPPVLTGFAIAHSDLLSKPLLPEPVLELGPVLRAPYAEPLTDRLAANMDTVIDRANAILMDNHGVIVMSYEDIERALDLLEMLEAMAASVATAVALGHVEFISDEELANLDNVSRVRAQPCPGKPGVFSSLTEAYGR
jgi:ribulose-5-phosphate 4-epimerase/fuculose-1-phosphate aldolase